MVVANYRYFPYEFEHCLWQRCRPFWMRALKIILTDKPRPPSLKPHFARHDLDTQISIDVDVIPNRTLEEQLSRSRNSSTRLRSPIAEMALWWGLPHTRFGKRLTSGVVCSHRQASFLRGERDLDNLTQYRLRMVLQNEHLPWNYFLSCFSRRAIGLHTPFLTVARCPADIVIH
jgi:hypothetical protein